MAGVHKACWDLGLWRKFLISFPQPWKKKWAERSSQPAPTVMLSAQKWLWVQRIRPWGWTGRKMPLLLQPCVTRGPVWGGLCPHVTFPAVAAVLFHLLLSMEIHSSARRRGVSQNLLDGIWVILVLLFVQEYFSGLGKHFEICFWPKSLSSSSGLAGSKCCWNWWGWVCAC